MRRPIIEIKGCIHGKVPHILRSIHLLNTDPILKCFSNSTLPYVDAQLSECADFEMRMGDCLEAYGLNKGKTKCEDFISDLRECLLKGKQKQRVVLMRKEHVRQYQNGERESMFSKTPNYNAY
ncbi:NADH dehydrogenase [ubiquinone] iron-sulfur protein 5 isoform X1 [Nasonia vitripennis]|uniref:Complex I-15 kDa n=1 Tax=Nasonia vitripennis TaxID=7425 RepID=A0A7M7Q3F0_NASVI|nr:NADH dehydrogenase [ubiquinone] iron-sulfur protein 5 isoform X1 [Nasonia vitripennis]